MKTIKPPSKLTQHIIEYQETGEALTPLIEEVALLVYKYPYRTLNWSEDDCGDFFCWFFPRIPAMVERFTFIGKDFEAYLFVTLKWQCRTFADKRRRVLKDARLFTCREFWPSTWEEDSAACELSPHLLSRPAQAALQMKDGKVTDDTSKRRLLYATMTGAPCITSHIVETLAAVTGFRSDWLFSCVEQLRQGLSAKRERIELLKGKRNRAFLRIYRIHLELSKEWEEKRRESLLRNLALEKKRLASALDEMARVPTAPTHRDIAAALGVPKGSVDSGIYYLKNALEERCA